MFPSEIWHVIFNELTSEDIATFQFVSKKLNDITNDYMQSSFFWAPLFHQLSTMPPYESIDSYQYSKVNFHLVFNQALNLVATQQKKELAQLNILNTENTKLRFSDVKLKHQQLEEINADNINKELSTFHALHKNFVNFTISTTEITRIPSGLKNNPDVLEMLNTVYKASFDSGFSFLHEKKISKIQHYVELGVDINARNTRGVTHLHLAVIAEDIPLIRELIGLGADINALDDHNRTPVHYYISHHHSIIKPEIIDFLINECGANIDTIDTEGDSPFTTLISRLIYEHGYDNHTDAIKWLILHTQYRADLPYYLGGKTTLHQLILKRGVKKAIPKLITWLINEGGANINVLNAAGQTPLAFYLTTTTFLPSKKTLRLLIELGANLNQIDNNGYTPLHLLITRDHNDLLIDLLIKAGSDVNAQTPQGETALHLSILHSKNIRLVFSAASFLKAQANMLAIDNNGRTVLHLAAINGDLLATKWFLENTKIRIDITDNDGHTAYDLAVLNNHIVVSDYLRAQEQGYQEVLKERTTCLLNAFSNFCQDMNTALHTVTDQEQQTKLQFKASDSEKQIRP